MKRDFNVPILQRRRVFLGCEGQSEQSYAALLSRLLDARHHRIHIDSVLLQPSSGDPLALVERAIKRMHERAARGDRYRAKAVLLDADTMGRSAERDARALVLARQQDMLLIWQEPCHEALLLRHLPGCDALRPPSSSAAMAELRRRWPDYRKGTAAARLAVLIDERGVLRAAATQAALKDFLDQIEFGRS